MVSFGSLSRDRLAGIVVGVGCALSLVPLVKADTTVTCNEIAAIIAQASGNFTDWASAEQQGEPPPVLSDARNCALSQDISGRQQYHCQWEFDYRSQNTYETFNQLIEAMQSCFENQAVARKDQGVNHPDTYDQRQFDLEDVVITVSLKDRAALSRTFVFLRVAAQLKNYQPTQKNE